MYTAKTTQKGFENGAYTVYVEFTNGEKTFTEQCKPQDRDGFDYWLKSRLDHFNSSEQLETDLVVGEAVEPPTVVVTPPVLTQAEIDKIEWFRDFERLKKVQQLAELGVVLWTDTPVVNLVNKVKDNFKPAYIADM